MNNLKIFKNNELAKILNCKIEDLFENDDQVDGDSGNERKE